MAKKKTKEIEENNVPQGNCFYNLELVINCERGTIFESLGKYYALEISLLDGHSYLKPLVVSNFA